MKRSLALITAIALGVLAFSAMMFDSTTVVVMAAAMLIVGFFSGAAVMFGVATRRAEQSRRPGPEAETITDDHSSQ